MDRSIRILNTIEEMYPNAETELNYKNLFELTVAVILSAQSTDISVNKVTEHLFTDYPDLQSLANAELSDVENHLRTIGLYKSKAKNIVLFANQVINNFDGEIPSDVPSLMTLAGIGRKTANVVVSEYFNIPAIAVDTHVERVTKRLKIVRESYNVKQTEERLMRAYPKERWAQAHHSFILFGRYTCKAQNPQCQTCPLQNDCKYYTKHHKHKAL